VSSAPCLFSSPPPPLPYPPRLSAGPYIDFQVHLPCFSQTFFCPPAFSVFLPAPSVGQSFSRVVGDLCTNFETNRRFFFSFLDPPHLVWASLFYSSACGTFCQCSRDRFHSLVPTAFGFCLVPRRALSFNFSNFCHLTFVSRRDPKFVAFYTISRLLRFFFPSPGPPRPPPPWQRFPFCHFFSFPGVTSGIKSLFFDIVLISRERFPKTPLFTAFLCPFPAGSPAFGCFSFSYKFRLPGTFRPFSIPT